MSTTQNPLNPEYTQDGEKRLRTKVACDYCRKRKSKCDGEQPCSKCISRKRQCVYSYVSKERKKREGSGVLDTKATEKRIKTVKARQNYSRVEYKNKCIGKSYHQISVNFGPFR